MSIPLLFFGAIVSALGLIALPPLISDRQIRNRLRWATIAIALAILILSFVYHIPNVSLPRI